MKVYVWKVIANVGDYWNAYLGKAFLKNPSFCSKEADMAFCGSMLGWKEISNTKIYGCGFMGSACRSGHLKEDNLFAVRGKNTADKLVSEIGLKKDLVLGDGGVLASRLFPNASEEKKWDVGVVLHHLDARVKSRTNLREGVKFIDTRTTDCETFFKEICECRVILSTSLHGLIFAHSYGIPAYHIQGVVLPGDDYKFRDYYSVFSDATYTKIRVKDFREIDKLVTPEMRSGAGCPSMESIGALQNELCSLYSTIEPRN